MEISTQKDNLSQAQTKQAEQAVPNKLSDTNEFTSSSVNSALQRIKNTLNYSLKKKYGIIDPTITAKFLAQHGLDAAHFDFINNFEKLIEKGQADYSIDTNANKGDKSITGFFVEAALPINKVVGYRYLYRKMKDMYGKARAKELSGDMYDMSIALADSGKILLPYCYSINASQLVLEGRPFGALPSLPPQRVNSYIAALSETVHQLSNHLAGAIAVGSFFLDVAYMILFREKKTLTYVEDHKEYQKYLSNSFQSFIHSMNHLSRNAVESPFTNISIMDRPKLRALIDDDNMGWYFNYEDAGDELKADFEAHKAAANEKGNEEYDWHDYVIDLIYIAQDEFMGVMNRGDIAHGGRVITFPVTTYNISRHKNEKGEYVADDPSWVDNLCNNYDVFRFNVFMSEGMKIASCCFSGDQKALVRWDGKEHHVKFRDIPQGKDLQVFNPLSQEWVDVDFFKTPYKGKMIRVALDGVSEDIICTPDHQIMVSTRAENGGYLPLYLKKAQDLDLRTDEVLVYDEKQKELVKTKIDLMVDVKPEDVKGNFAYCLNYKNTGVTNDRRVFTLNNGVVVHNCRLINDIDLFNLGGQVNSFGGSGSALSLGSHRVATINLRRIALECTSPEDYFKRLKYRMDEAADILIAHRALLKDLIAKGTQPFLENGWLDLNRMFSTFGLLGYYEAARDLKSSFDPDRDFMKEIFQFIESYSFELTKERHNQFNVEGIPAETMAVKCANDDRWLYGEANVPEKLYANQYVPLFEEGHTIWERLSLDGRYNNYLTGGNITHISMGEKLTPKQYRKIIDYAMAKGVEHFAINVSYDICANDHYNLGAGDVCPECGAPIVDHLTRTVGFYTKTSNWTKVKREDDFANRDYAENAERINKEIPKEDCSVA